MDIFNQNKFLTRIIISLVILNLLVISFVFFKNIYHQGPLLYPKNETYKDVSNILKKELNLNENQFVEFNKIREKYFDKEVVLKQTIRDQKDSMNMIMFNKYTNDELVLTLARIIADNEYKMEILRYEQAKEMKVVCTPKQQEKFQNLVREIRDYFRPDNQLKRK